MSKYQSREDHQSLIPNTKRGHRFEFEEVNHNQSKEIKKEIESGIKLEEQQDKERGGRLTCHQVLKEGEDTEIKEREKVKHFKKWLHHCQCSSLRN